MATAWDQTSFRGRNDDGNETTATWIAAANTNWSQALDTNFRFRIVVTETGTTSATLACQLQYNKNAAGWNAVNATSLVCRSSSSANLTDGSATTEQISAATFVAGFFDSGDGLESTTASIARNRVTELEWCVQLRSADVAPGDTIQLRGVVSPSTAFGAYTNTPTITAIAVTTLHPAAGSETFTGATPKLTTTLHPAAAAETFTGATPKLTLTLHPTAASETFTGQNVTITNNLTTVLHPAAGSLAFTGATPKLSLTVHPAAASLSLTGQAAKFTATLHPVSAAVVYSGATPALKFILHPAADSMTLTGQSVSITNLPPAGGGGNYITLPLLGVG